MITTLILSYLAIGFLVGLEVVLAYINGPKEENTNAKICLAMFFIFMFIWPVVFTLEE